MFHRSAFGLTIVLWVLVLFVQCEVDENEWERMIKNDGFSYKIKNFRSKRFVSFESLEPNREFQECIAPGNKTGHCRHLHYCLVDEIKTNYASFLNHMCRINAMFVGICCPDKIENETLVVSEKLIIEPKNDLLPSIREGNGISGREKTRGCGIRPNSRTRIVGGRPADPKEWPWMAALLRDYVTQYCGGVLVTNRHVISAAHCTENSRPQQIRIRLGEYDFKREDDSESRDFRVVDVKQHPDYNGESFSNDISVLKMHREVVFDDYVWPICLPVPNDDFVNKTAVVTGWGTLGFAEPTSDVLMEVDIQIWSQDKCEAALSQNMSETQVCAGSFNQRKDACQGDSGGPLMHRVTTGQWVVVGIVSWGKACGMIGQPGIYTRVNKYLPWLIENSRI